MNADQYSKSARTGGAAALCCAAGLAFFLAPAAQAGTSSAWNEGSVKVDGAAGEWDEESITEKDGLAVAFANDDRDLYVYVAALDKDASAQLTGRYKQTFTLWVNGKGSRKKTFGVKLSPGHRPAGVPPKGAEKDPSSAAPAAGTPPAMDDEQAGPPAERAASTVTYAMAIVDAEAELGALADDGVEFAAGLNRRKRTVFEFKVPLSLVTVKGKDVLSIGFETSEIDSSAMGGGKGGPAGSSGSAAGSGRPGGMGGGPRGGMGGGPGGGMGGRPGEGMGGGPGGGQGGSMRGGPGGSGSGSGVAIADPIGFWLKVKLAAGK